MKIGLAFLNQVRDGTPEGGWTAETFDAFIAQLVSSYSKEHTSDDGHSTIHATGNIYERSRTVAMGDWAAQPFLATDYVGTGAMTWTVSSTTFSHLRYMRIGSTVLIDFKVVSAVLGGTADTALRLTIPQSFKAANDGNGSFHYVNGAASGGGSVSVMAGDTYLTLTKSDASNWSTASTVSVDGQIAIEVAATISSITLASPVLTWTGTTSGAINLLGVSTLYWGPGTYSVSVNRTCTLTCVAIAGGAGGGGSVDATNGGGGGGSGGVTGGTTVVLTNGKVYTMVVGAAGSAGANGVDGGNGGNTTLVNTTDTVNLVVIGGGSGVNTHFSNGGGAGTATTGSNLFTGQPGGAGAVEGGAANAAGNANANGAGSGGGGGDSTRDGQPGGAGKDEAGGAIHLASGGTGGGRGGGMDFNGTKYGYGGAGAGCQTAGGAGTIGGAGQLKLTFLSAP